MPCETRPSLSHRCCTALVCSSLAVAVAVAPTQAHASEPMLGGAIMATGMSPTAARLRTIMSLQDPDAPAELTGDPAGDAPPDAAPVAQGPAPVGPAPAPIARIRGRHRVRLLVRAPRGAPLQPALADWTRRAGPLRGGLRLAIDIDPQSFL